MNTPDFILIHSPLVGTLTWQLVAEELRKQGYNVLTPELMDRPDSAIPSWQPENNLDASSALLVGHSGAGALLPMMGEMLKVRETIFVDAVLLFESSSYLELMRKEDAEFAQNFEDYLRTGGRFPNWTDEQLQGQIPDADLRRKLVVDLRPRGLDYFTEQINAPENWHEKPCAYIQLSAFYGSYAKQAEARNWQVIRREGHHFEMLTHPADIAHLLMDARDKLIG